MLLLLQEIPERQPALLSLIYMGGLALMVLILILSLIRSRRRRSSLAAIAPADLPKEVRERLGATATNRGLRVVRWVFVLLTIGVFASHVYWALYARDTNERFQQLSYKDLRNRRLADSTLRGWILDRSGRLDTALALYRREGNGQIVREYPLDRAMAHLFGADRGDPGLERALFGVESSAAPEALDIVLNRNLRQASNLDVRLTIDRDLQQAVVDQLRGRNGAVVIMNPQTGEILAMYSNPSYSLNEVRDEGVWRRLEANRREQPLVNRALGEYYVPGSTFKTITMIAAAVAGRLDAEFVCSGSGYYAERGARPIYDDQGPGEVHGRIGVGTAFEVSCNQYFAQLAVDLGPDRMRAAARLLGIGAYDTPEEALRGRRLPEIWNASSRAAQRALAPRESTMVTRQGMRPYDLALEGFGQGMAGQMTPFQLALAAAAVGNLEGRLMKPRIEFDRPNEVFNQVVTPQAAAEMRRVMGLVTGGPSGTATRVFAPIHAAGIITGGKTGTAQKEVPLYDPRTGVMLTETRYERDARGNIIRQYEVPRINPEPRIDAWFICIAPLENPQIAMAVIIEGEPGRRNYGGAVAAPVAAELILRARELGLLGQPAATRGNNERGGTPPNRNRRARPVRETN
jgi:penicillin-binding protein A